MGSLSRTKGRFVTADRQKHLMIASQYPLLDIRFVFSNPRNRISKAEQDDLREVCEKNQFRVRSKDDPNGMAPGRSYTQTSVNATMHHPGTGTHPPRRPSQRGKSAMAKTDIIPGNRGPHH